ncbi:hypothetical protein PFISCL1PPCAC_26694 [Pristionchus fissidentatus]|uniref:Ion transport domain-containing protein n=1 Tax=Pristionchus fissidentatus TaxID=1538716 RepID=A0AAV5X062_9BILA|nr:hypothetical protein PFISCL1PPCAC_26694 [Pristionchus fissidentatus]
MSFNSSDTRGSLYGLVDEHASGILVSWIKYARATGDYGILDEYCPLVSLQWRKGKVDSNRGRGKSGPNILDDINQEKLDQADFLKALKVLDGGGSRQSFRYRELVWDVNQRGNMGENLLHICLLHNTVEQNDLAKFLVKKFPRLVNDIFISEDYYGLSPLHQAIVNEDVETMYFLLKNNADVHQRCYGAFFCAEDQKSSRTDSLEHEWVDLNPNTRYTGQMYWGEYPLSFAACTNQRDAFRLLKAFKADSNKQDTNGNTAMHLAVIHDLPEMFTLIFQMGANLHVRNNQKLTPLALAAKIANKKMYDLILRLEMDVVWRYGDTVCEVFSLEDIDTIRQDTGDLNPSSVLANIVYGDKASHLDFFDGLIEDILEKKWEVFAKKRMFLSLFGYLWFLLMLSISFTTRDLVRIIRNYQEVETEEDSYGESDNSTNSSMWSTIDDDPQENYTLLESILIMDKFLRIRHPWQPDFPLPPQCHLWEHKRRKDKVRLIAEIFTLLTVVLRTARDWIDIQRSGYKRWFRTIAAFPEKVLHKVAQLSIFVMIPIRFMCFLSPAVLLIENIMIIAVVIMSSLHFFFYCRGLKFVGPFVLMVYKIIAGDMLRFFVIYAVFITAFAQAFFLIFQSCERAELDYLARHPDKEREFENIVSNSFETMMRMFIMSVGEFGMFYKNLNDCKSNLAGLGKVFFTLYELIVTIMLLNLLIAMMTRTYEKIAEAQKEWKRQWAQVILMLEQGLSAQERLLVLYSYSRPLKSDKRHRAFIVKEKRKISQEELRHLDIILPRKKLSISRNTHSPIIQLNDSGFEILLK